MRYLAEYIEPTTGLPRMGTLTKVVREYKGDYNALRYLHYHLRHKTMPAGQYRVIAWPYGAPEREVGYLYKRG